MEGGVQGRSGEGGWMRTTLIARAVSGAWHFFLFFGNRHGLGQGETMFGGGKPLPCPLGRQFFPVHFHRANYPASAGVLMPLVFGHGARDVFPANGGIADGGAEVPCFGIGTFRNLLQLQSPMHSASSHARGGPQGCCACTWIRRTRRGQNANHGPGRTTPTVFFPPWLLPLF